ARTVSVAIFGNADLWALKERAESLRDDLLGMDGISQVSLAGLPAREIAVTVSEASLRKYTLTFTEIANAISSANIDISGGSIKTHDEQLLIRAYGRRDFAYEVRSIILRTTKDGTTVRIGDVAQVTENWEDTPDATYYNGKRAVIVNIDKTMEEDIIGISKIVSNYIKDFKEKHPEISVKVISDATIQLKQRINLLVKNGLLGFFLVVLVLGIFLNATMSFWVAMGIPISFAGMFIIAYLWGITINVISLMGMIVVIGMLVDDAIVVAESIYQKFEHGFKPLPAAINGLVEVAAPVFTAVATTILAFLPFFFFAGTMGRFINQLALVVIAALVFSLVESIFILPAHLVHSRSLYRTARAHRIRAFFDKSYIWLRDKIYSISLGWILKNPLIIFAAAFAFVIITIGLIRGNIVEFSAFPYIDRDDISLNLTMTTGTRETVTDSILMELEDRIWSINEQLKSKRKDKKDVILSIRRNIGNNGFGDAGSHAGYLAIEMLESGIRGMPSFKVQNLIRNSMDPVPGSQKLSFAAGRWGKAISISLISNDFDELEKAKKLLKAKLSEYSLLSDITDSDVEGWREIRLALKPAAHSAGLTLTDIAGQIRQGFFGHEVQRFQRGEDELRVWVRYMDEDRASLGSLENMYIRAKDGSAYPLSMIADYTIKRGRVVISHLDGKRELRVEADMTDPEASVSSLLAHIRKNAVPQVLKQVKNVYVSYEGRERSNKLFFDSFKAAFPPALIAIAVLLVLVFRSPLQAVLILFMIPLGLLGAVWGHLFHGFMISRLSVFGAIALAGIVINDSIVLVDRINRNLKEGMSLVEAIQQAGLSRLRPIILTTVTTVAGMLPLVLDTGSQAQFLIPMAVSLCYGLMASSFFVLYFLPALFLGLNRFRLKYAGLFSSSISPESVEPAVR
ncbi:MAG: efflux RND transporter permease subunit, partial [bacterium]